MKRNWWAFLLLVSCGTPADAPKTRTANGKLTVAVGQRFGCVLNPGVGVYCWGENMRGQLGQLSIGFSETPVLVAGTEDAIDLVAGRSHACVRTDDDVLCWGANDREQLGGTYPGAEGCFSGFTDGGPPTVPCHPTPVSLGIEAIAIAAGDESTCVIEEGGLTRCFGGAASQIPGRTQVEIGTRTACGLGNDGKLSCANDESLTYTQAFRELPVATHFAITDDNGCVVADDGEVLCWGSSNSRGQLGAGHTDIVQPWESSNPASGMVAVVNGHGHFCALTEAGVVWCWGGNSIGQLGVAPGSADGGYEMIEGEELDIPRCPNGSCRPIAAAVTKLPPAKQLSAYGDSNCIVTEDDDVMCWGRLAEGATPRTIDGPW